MHGHNMLNASNCARIIRVMDVRACARVPVFEKVHALMKCIHMTSNGKYTKIARQRRRCR